MDLKRRNNPKYTEISIYVILTVIVIYVLSKVADHAPLLFATGAAFLKRIGNILTPLIAGFVIAYLLYPIVSFIRKELMDMKYFKKRKKDPKSLAVALTFLIAAAILILGLSLIISAVTHEVAVFSLDSFTEIIGSVSKSIQGFYFDLQRALNKLNIPSDQLRQIVNSATQFFGQKMTSFGNSVAGSVTNITGFAANAAFALILSIYFLIDAENLEEYWDKVLRAVTPQRFYRRFHQALQDADTVFSGYIRGQLIDAILMAIMISISLSIVGVKFSVMIGILAGIGNLIPYVGPFIAYGLTILITLIGGDFKKLLIAVIVLFVIQTIDGNVINPKLLSSNTSVHPMLVIVALLFGSAVGGIMGMLLAVPVAALLKIWFDRLVQKLAQKRELS